jgi:hypothetical protein
LALQDNAEIEVECKSTSGGTGRKINRREVNRLGDLPTTQQLLETPGCHLIRVVIPGRLAPADQELAEIASTVASAGQQKCSASGDLARAEYCYKNISVWSETNRDPSARRFFEKLLDTKNSQILFHSHPGHSIVAIMIASAKADNVVDAIATQGKNAAKCSGTRPAVIAMHLIDQIGRPELEGLLKRRAGCMPLLMQCLKMRADYM